MDTNTTEEVAEVASTDPTTPIFDRFAGKNWVLDDLPASDVRTGTKVDPVIKRRNAFLDMVTSQQALFVNPLHSVERKVYRKNRDTGVTTSEMEARQPKPWWIGTADGNVKVSPRYGNKNITINGKPAVRLPKAEVPDFLTTVTQMINEGYFDDQLMVASAKSRSR